MSSRTETDLPMGMPAARKLSGEELGLALLGLLEQAPGYGSELGDRIERMTGGFYRPSPGSLYPVLTRLSEAGHIEQQRQGRCKYYRITRQGIGHRQEREATGRRTLDRLERAGRKYVALRQAMAEISDDEGESGRLAQQMLESRMHLKALLHQSRHRSLATQRRILELLEETNTRLEQLLAAANKDRESPGED